MISLDDNDRWKKERNSGSKPISPQEGHDFVSNIIWSRLLKKKEQTGHVSPCPQMKIPRSNNQLSRLPKSTKPIYKTTISHRQLDARAVPCSNFPAYYLATSTGTYPRYILIRIFHSGSSRERVFIAVIPRESHFSPPVTCRSIRRRYLHRGILYPPPPVQE